MNSTFLHGVTSIRITETELFGLDGQEYGSREIIIEFEEGNHLSITLFADGESRDSYAAIEEALALKQVGGSRDFT